MPGIEDGIYGVIPSVTEILAACGLAPDLSAIPPAVLEHARERGTYVHEAIGLYLGGALDMDALHPQIVPRVAAFAAWAAETGFVPLPDGIEHECIDLEARVCGHMDLVGYVYPGDLVMIDLKSSLDRKSVTVQLAGYDFLWRRQHPTEPITKHIALVLNGTPKARAVPIPVKDAEAAWLGALAITEWRRK